MLAAFASVALVAALGCTPTAAATPSAPGLASLQARLDCWTDAGAWRRLRRAPRDGDAYEWVPSRACAPPLPPLSAVAWCEAHAGVRLLFIGDSTSGENYNATLAFARAARAGAPAARTANRTIACDSRLDLWPHQHGCASAVACAGAVAVGFVRNDHLEAVSGRAWQPRPTNLLMHPLDDALVAWAPTHVMLNRGAHYASDAHFRAGLVRAVALVRRLAPGAHVLLRSTPPGHPGCARHTRPLTSPRPITDAVGRSHHWDSFARQNGIMRTVAADTGVLFVDYATPTALRPDGHASPFDCLHYSPKGRAPLRGALATWVRLVAGAVGLLRGSAS